MYNRSQLTKTELFTELSEHEQEKTSGGIIVGFFNTKELIHSTAEGSMNYSQGGDNISMNQSSTYLRWRESNAMIIDLSSYYYSGRKHYIAPMTLLRRILGLFF